MIKQIIDCYTNSHEHCYLSDIIIIAADYVLLCTTGYADNVAKVLSNSSTAANASYYCDCSAFSNDCSFLSYIPTSYDNHIIVVLISNDYTNYCDCDYSSDHHIVLCFMEVLLGGTQSRC